jgi:hypothetical protein
MSEELPAHEVTVARPWFEYTPVDEASARAMARHLHRPRALQGDVIVVNDQDYRRGCRFGAFAGEPPPATHEVTIALAGFTYVPVPFPANLPEGFSLMAMMGETILVDDQDYERGRRLGAFTECGAPSPYGVIGEPPITGHAAVWLNWIRAADTHAFEQLLAQLATAAAGDPARAALVPQVREQLFEGRDDNDEILSFRAHRAQELAQEIVQPAADAAALADLEAKVASGLITGEAGLRILLGAVQAARA